MGNCFSSFIKLSNNSGSAVVLIQQNLLLEKVTFTSLNKLDSFLKRLTGNASNTSFAIIKPLIFLSGNVSSQII